MRIILSILISIVLLPILVAQSPHHFGFVLGVDYLQRTGNNISGYVAPSYLQYRIGGDYLREISPTLTLRTGTRLTGFGYEKTAPRLVSLPATGPSQVNWTMYALTFDRSPGINWRETDFYVEIPLVARYNSPSATHFYLEGGITTFFYLKTYSREPGYQSRSDWYVSQEAQRVIPALQVSMGWEWLVGKQGYFYLQPAFRYLFTVPGRQNMYSGGLEMGVRW